MRYFRIVGVTSAIVVLLLMVVLYGAFVSSFGYVTLVRHFGQPDGRMVPDLNLCLDSDNRQVKEAAAMRLADLGSKANAALPAITTSFLNGSVDSAGNDDASWYLTYAITKMGDDGFNALALASVARRNSGRGLAVSQFRDAPPERQADALIRLLVQIQDDETQTHTRDHIVRWLGALGPNANAEPKPDACSWPHRLEPYSAHRPGVSDAVAKRAAEAILTVYAGQDLPDEASRSLFRLGQPAVAPLCEELKSQLAAEGVWQLRLPLIEVIRALGPLAQEAAPILEEQIRCEDVWFAIRDELDTLAAIEPVDRTNAANIIRKGIDDNIWTNHLEDLNRLRSQTLSRIGDEVEIQRLVNELEHFPKPRTWGAIRSLGAIGPPAISAIPSLRAILENVDSEQMRVEAVAAMIKIDGNLAGGMPVLLKGLDSGMPEVRGVACLELGEIGPVAHSAIQPLTQMTDSTSNPDEHVRIAAVIALSRVDPTSEETAEILRRVLDADPSSKVSEAALMQLEKRDSPFEIQELDDAIATLKNHWRKDAPYPPAVTTRFQAWRAKESIRMAADRGAVRLAEWMLAGGAPDGLEVRALFHSLGADRAAAVPLFVQAIDEDPTSPTAKIAIQSLGEIGPAAQSAAPTILRATKAPTLKEPAEDALRSIDPDEYLHTQRSYHGLAILLGGPAAFLILLIGWPMIRRRTAKLKKPSADPNAA